MYLRGKGEEFLRWEDSFGPRRVYNGEPRCRKIIESQDVAPQS